jgi:hypothetical protein
VDKYKELYDYAIGVLSEEHDRFTRADEKAAKYGTMAVFLIGINAYFSKTIMDTALPPRGWLEWLMILLASLALLSSGIGWYVSNSAIRLTKFRGRRLNEAIVDFFGTKPLVDVYYGVAKRIAVVYREDVEITNRKHTIIERAELVLRCAVAATVALALLYAMYRYRLAAEIAFPNSVV